MSEEETDQAGEAPAPVAVIIAAGQGKRLRDSTGDDKLIKPISKILGVPLIVRVLRTLHDEGVQEAVVVTGYQPEALQSTLRDDPRLKNLKLTFAHNEDWQKSNGLSVLTAREAVGDRNFFLSMSDHVYSREVVQALKADPPAEGELVLAVDHRIDEVNDPDDAMWVRLGEGGAIKDIAKDLTEYDVVDTGVFLCTPALFEALAAERDERGGDCGLFQGVARLASSGKARTADIGAAWWQDVDTVGDLGAARKKLLKSLRKPIDGIVARSINRYVSLPISAWLVDHTGFTPNQMSVFCLLQSLAAAALVAFSGGDYLLVLLGAALMQFSSIFDGVDGEIARLKWQFTGYGEWIDTICDDISNYAYVASITYMAYVSGWPVWFSYLGIVALVGYAFAIPLAYSYILLYTDSGDVMAVDYDFNLGEQSFRDTRLHVWLLARVKYVTKRDFFLFAFFCFSVIGVLPIALIPAAAGAIGVAIAAGSQHLKKITAKKPS